jgi:hypothetical protein
LAGLPVGAKLLIAQGGLQQEKHAMGRASGAARDARERFESGQLSPCMTQQPTTLRAAAGAP